MKNNKKKQKSNRAKNNPAWSIQKWKRYSNQFGEGDSFFSDGKEWADWATWLRIEGSEHEAKNVVTQSSEIGSGQIVDIRLISVSYEELATLIQQKFDCDEVDRIYAEFRMAQPALYRYVPYSSPTPRDLQYENRHICVWARRLCEVLKKRYGQAPILGDDEIRSSEPMAKSMLADPKRLESLQQEHLLQLAVALPKASIMDGDFAVADRNRLLLKALTLLVAFSRAVFHRQRIKEDGDATSLAE